MKYDKFYQLTRNAAKCLACGDVVESKHRHDFRSCTCGKLSVDGGLEYSRRMYSDWTLVEDMNTYRKFTLDELKNTAESYRGNIWEGSEFGTRMLAEVTACAFEWYGENL